MWQVTRDRWHMTCYTRCGVEIHSKHLLPCYYICLFSFFFLFYNKQLFIVFLRDYLEISKWTKDCICNFCPGYIPLQCFLLRYCTILIFESINNVIYFVWFWRATTNQDPKGLPNLHPATSPLVQKSYSCASPCANGQRPGARGGCPSTSPPARDSGGSSRRRRGRRWRSLEAAQGLRVWPGPCQGQGWKV